MRTRFSFRIVLATLLAPLALLAGCTAQEPKPTLVPVRVKVLAGEKPAAGALVTLHSEAPSLWTPRGVVEADGTLVPSVAQGSDGAAPGRYRVTVQWPRGIETQPRERQLEAAFSGDVADRFEGKLADPKTTTLSLTVEPAGGELPPLRLPE